MDEIIMEIHSELLKRILKVVSVIQERFLLIIDPKQREAKIRIVDASHIAMMEMKIPETVLSYPMPLPQDEKIKLGFSVSDIMHYLYVASGDLVLRIYEIEKNIVANKSSVLKGTKEIAKTKIVKMMNISMKKPKGLRYSINIELLDPDEAFDPKIPPLTHAIEFYIDPAAFKWLSDLNEGFKKDKIFASFTDYYALAGFATDKNGQFTMYAFPTGEKVKTVSMKDSVNRIAQCGVAIPPYKKEIPELFSTYDMERLLKIISVFDEVQGEIYMKFQKDYPMVFNWLERSGCQITFLIAPRIECE